MLLSYRTLASRVNTAIRSSCIDTAIGIRKNCVILWDYVTKPSPYRQCALVVKVALTGCGPGEKSARK
eukprot:scaffold22582_cov194-Cylindrotheca_fusiformis.AAC.6